MIEIDNVVAALEDLNRAVAEYNAMGTSKMFAGMSFALEEAADDTKQEAKKGLWAKLKAFIARAIEWIKKKFSGKKDPAQAIAENKKEIDEIQKKTEQEFDAFMASMKENIAASEKAAASQVDDIISKAKANAAAKVGARAELPADFDEQAIKAVIASGVVQDRAKGIIAQYAATAILIAATGKADVKATIDKADQLGNQLIPFCDEMEKLSGMKGQQLADAFMALSEKTKELKTLASSFWGTAATENAKKICENTPPEVLLKQMGSVDNLAGQRRIMPVVKERIMRVTDRLGNMDLAEGLGDEDAKRIYGENGAQDAISALMMNVAWADHYSSYGLDTKMRYINQFNASKAGNEKIDALAKGFVDKYNITPEKAREAVLFSVGVAHLRLMNAQ